jgi:diguanylate cyclase (GGDEF)-like protein
MKWTSIYLIFCVLPLFVYFLPKLPDIASHHVVTDFFIYVPYVGLLIVAVLGWQINQTRIFWASLSTVVLYHYLLHPSLFIAATNKQERSFEILTVGYPLFLAILFFINESRLWSDKTLSRLLLSFTPLILLVALYGWAPDIPPKIFYWKILSNAASGWPEFCGLSLGVLGLVIFLTEDPKIKPFLVSFFLGLAPLYLSFYVGLIPDPALNRAAVSFHIIFSFSILSAVLLHAILHMYWKRVYQDSLTGIPNRQSLDERLHTLPGNYVLAMADIDHFKKFNDTYGHAEGDNVLRMVAEHLHGHLGQRVYRYGGEEFCVIFEGTDSVEAQKLLDETRLKLEKRRFVIRTHRRRKGETENPDSKKLGVEAKVKITISIGLAAIEKNSQNYHDVIKRADQALYQAKNKGRNCVIAAK